MLACNESQRTLARTGTQFFWIDNHMSGRHDVRLVLLDVRLRCTNETCKIQISGALEGIKNN